MDDSDLPMEEYIRLEEEKTQKRGQSFDWRSATYGKVNYFDDIDYFRDFKSEFPAIVFNETPVSKLESQPKPTVSSPIVKNLDFDFKISFDEYDDEDYTFAYDKNSFSYKLIPISNSKPDSVNDDQFNNLESSSNVDDLETKNEAISIETPIKTLSETGKYGKPISFSTAGPIRHMALPPRDQRYPHLRFKGLGYNEADIGDFDGRLGRIFRRRVHRMPVLDFGGLPDLMAERLTERMIMEHRDAQGVIVFSSRSWRVGDLVLELDTAGALQFQLGDGDSWFGVYWTDSARETPDKGDLDDYWRAISSVGDFLRSAPYYTAIRDPILRLCHRLIACSIAGRSQAPEKVTVIDLFYLRGMDISSVNVPYLLSQYLRRFTFGWKQGALISGGQFVARLAAHFGLLIELLLQGLTMITSELPVIDIAKIGAEGAPDDDTAAQAAPAPV
ncbi:hypothetical protein Tco_0974859 [Tanacetum coccineum]|uniref:Uncharacterized protein n=1 Tax=Tanacetum coccineum TaxID=301880 RepID=A0ABQ5EDW2_9ASTR